MDKALGRAMTPHQRPPGAYGRGIRAPPLGQGAPCLHALRLPRRDPGVTRVAVPLTDPATAGGDLLRRAGPHRIAAAAVREEGVVGHTPVCRGRQPQAGRSEGGPWGRTALVMVRGREGRRCRWATRASGACLPPSWADGPAPLAAAPAAAPALPPPASAVGRCDRRRATVVADRECRARPGGGRHVAIVAVRAAGAWREPERRSGDGLDPAARGPHAPGAGHVPADAGGTGTPTGGDAPGCGAPTWALALTRDGGPRPGC